MTRNFWLSTGAVGIAVAASVMAASCSGTDATTVSLRASTAGTALTAQGASTLSSATIPAGTLVNTLPATAACTDDAPGATCGDLTIQRVRVLVRRTILDAVTTPAGTVNPVATGTSATDWQEEGECEHDQSCRHDDRVEIGPYVIDLCGVALAGTTVDVQNLPAPQGDYRDVKFVVNTIYRARNLSPALQAMKDAHASIIVKGTYGPAGTFTFRTPIRVAQERDGTFTFREGANPVTMNLNPFAWFAGPDGKALDPNDSRNRGAILANIRCALHAFPGDRDGDEDSERAACASPASASRRSHDADRGMCGNEDEHRDWEGCHHCCNVTPLSCGNPGAVTPPAGSVPSAPL